MKNIFKIIAVFMLPLLVVTSCVDDDKLFELSDFKNGAIANLVPTTNDDGFINLLDLNSTVIEYTVDFAVNFPQDETNGTGGSGKESSSLMWADVSSFDLELSYTSAVTGELETGVIGNYTSWPVTVTLSVDDLIAAIPSLTSQADLNLADQFVFVSGVNLADGTKLPAFVKDPSGKPVPGYSVNFNGAGNNPGVNFSLAYNVSCPSEIPTSGTWTGVTQEGAFGIFSTNATIEITALGSGKYVITDVTGGFYAGFGFNTDQEVTFEDVCNSLTIIDNGNAQFNIGTDAANGYPSGTWDPVTETITFPWFDGGNGFGDVTVMTRN